MFLNGIRLMALVIARAHLQGYKRSYSSTALVDTSVRMTLIDRLLAEEMGVGCTGRILSFISISGQPVKASEAVVSMLEIEGEILRYEIVAVADISESVKKVLAQNGFDENIIIGLLTIERANMMPDTTSGVLRKVESFIF